jgi:hypothetical protein
LGGQISKGDRKRGEMPTEKEIKSKIKRETHSKRREIQLTIL